MSMDHDRKQLGIILAEIDKAGAVIARVSDDGGKHVPYGGGGEYELMQTDAVEIEVLCDKDGSYSYMYLVYGNGPGELLADYTVPKPGSVVAALIERIEEGLDEYDRSTPEYAAHMRMLEQQLG